MLPEPPARVALCPSATSGGTHTRGRARTWRAARTIPPCSQAIGDELHRVLNRPRPPPSPPPPPPPIQKITFCNAVRAEDGGQRVLEIPETYNAATNPTLEELAWAAALCCAHVRIVPINDLKLSVGRQEALAHTHPIRNPHT